MEYFFLVFSGVIGGAFGGMGMGGGTLLIPILTIFFAFSQHVAQTINLICFIPMSVIALIIHAKRKLIKFSDVLYVVLSGVFFCVLGCYISKQISGNILSKIFGGFLIILAIFQFVNLLIDKKSKGN